jgi:integrase
VSAPAADHIHLDAGFEEMDGRCMRLCRLRHKRHTFCSHLAMKGAPARAIQELAGHADLSMTQRYMHLSPAATEDAIRLLDGRLGDLKACTP